MPQKNHSKWNHFSPRKIAKASERERILLKYSSISHFWPYEDAINSNYSHEMTAAVAGGRIHFQLGPIGTGFWYK